MLSKLRAVVGISCNLLIKLFFSPFLKLQAQAVDSRDMNACHFWQLVPLCCRPALSGSKFRSYGFHSFADGDHPFAASRRGVNQLFKVCKELRCQGTPHFREKWFHLRVHAEMFAVCIVEKINRDYPMIHHRDNHIPIAKYHTQMTAVLKIGRASCRERV